MFLTFKMTHLEPEFVYISSRREVFRANRWWSSWLWLSAVMDEIATEKSPVRIRPGGRSLSFWGFFF